MEDKHVNELKGANMDIDLVSDNVDWNQCTCPWNEAENTKEHKSGIKRSKSLATARLFSFGYKSKIPRFIEMRKWSFRMTMRILLPSLQNKSVCLIADA